MSVFRIINEIIVIKGYNQKIKGLFYICMHVFGLEYYHIF